MALQQEVWIDSIQEVLFKNSAFIQKGTNHSEYVANKVVHLPQAGSIGSITKNRSSYPASISQRSDSELTYNLESYDVGPIHIADIDELQTSYNKRVSVLSQHTNALSERVGDELAYLWAATGSDAIFRTSGSSSSDALAPSATGTRFAITKDDVRKLAKKMDKDNVSMNGRYLVLPTDMYYQLFADSTLVSRDYMERASQETGVITQLYGFNIMARPTVAVYDDTTLPVKKAVGASGAATDHLAAIAFQMDYVSFAQGDIKVFANENAPEYFGSIFSAMVMLGGSILRTDQKGVAALVQTEA